MRRIYVFPKIYIYIYLETKYITIQNIYVIYVVIENIHKHNYICIQKLYICYLYNFICLDSFMYINNKSIEIS